MRRVFAIIALAIAAFIAVNRFDAPVDSGGVVTERNDALFQAIADRRSDVWVEGKGVVVKVLPDDEKGSRHQRFVLEIEGGGTILIAHNIDLAERIPSLEKGDIVGFRGQFEWNAKGGVVHWTHHDPGGRKEGGQLQHQGRVYR